MKKLSLNNSKQEIYTQAEIDTLDPAVFGVGSLQRDDGVVFWCDGVSIKATKLNKIDNAKTFKNLLLEDFTDISEFNVTADAANGGGIANYPGGGIQITSGIVGGSPGYTRPFRTVAPGEFTVNVGDTFAVEVEVEEAWVDETAAKLVDANNSSHWVNGVTLVVEFRDGAGFISNLTLRSLYGFYYPTYPNRKIYGKRVIQFPSVPAVGVTNNDVNSIKSSSTHASFNFTDFNTNGGELRVKVEPFGDTATGQGNHKIVIKKLYKNNVCKPKLVYTMDDGYSGWFTYRNEFISRDIKPTMFLGKDRVQAGAGNDLNEAQLKSLVFDNDWDAQNHTASEVLLTQLTKDQQKAEIFECEQWLSSLGISRRNKALAYVGGDFNEETKFALSELGFDLARLAGGVSDDDAMFPNGLDDSYTVPIVAVGEYTTTTAIINAIDANIAGGMHTFILGHEIVATGGAGDQTNVATLQTVLDAIKTRVDNGSLEVLTMSEFIELHK